jgi:hypothetical protein
MAAGVLVVCIVYTDTYVYEASVQPVNLRGLRCVLIALITYVGMGSVCSLCIP